MFKIEFGGKEYKIKFGYKPTLKDGLLHKLANAESDDNDIVSIENTMLLVPEMVLVGLQVFHKDEFGYDYNTNEGFDEQLDKVFDLVDTYLSEGADFQELYAGLENELLTDGFLASVFRKEIEKAEQKTTKTRAKKNTQN